MKYYFGDNREYGADDIKKAFGVLAAKGGIELGLSDGEEYDASALNRLIGAAVAKGVVTESNSCLRLDRKNDEYYINPGKAVFSDGGIAEVEEETKVDIGKGSYLYIAYNETLDEVYFLVKSAPVEDGGGVLTVPIAYVEENGAVRDLRVFARGKLPALPSATWNVLREAEFTIDQSTITFGDLHTGGYVEARHPIEGDINFMMVEREACISYMNIKDGAATYRLVANGGSGYRSNSRDCLCVGFFGSMYRATYLGGGQGYINMRYYIPSGQGLKSYTYKALVGIVSNGD